MACYQMFLIHKRLQMSDSKIVVPFNKKAALVLNEDKLQAQMFVELEQAGYLRVKSIGATCSIWKDGIIIARVIYLHVEDAAAIANKMLDYFGKTNMVNWAATVDTVEIF